MRQLYLRHVLRQRNCYQRLQGSGAFWLTLDCVNDDSLLRSCSNSGRGKLQGVLSRLVLYYLKLKRSGLKIPELGHNSGFFAVLNLRHDAIP